VRRETCKRLESVRDERGLDIVEWQETINDVGVMRVSFRTWAVRLCGCEEAAVNILFGLGSC